MPAQLYFDPLNGSMVCERHASGRMDPRADKMTAGDIAWFKQMNVPVKCEQC